MIQALSLLLSFQLAGEVIARAFGLSVPGPVLGMVGLLALFLIWPRAFALIEPLAKGLLAHLSLLFVPAGVGVVGHMARLGEDGAPLLVAIVVSTALAIVVGALVFTVVARLTGGAQ